MKTKLLSLISFLFCIFFSVGQTPSWAWARNTGSTSTNNGNCITTDAHGNVYVTGMFQGPSITFGSQTFTNQGQGDIFITKYDANGNVLWAKSAGGNGWDAGNAVAVDALGNLIVTGYFCSSSIVFDTDTLSNANDLIYHFFIVKIDTDGNVLWAKNPLNNNWSYGQSLVTDKQSNVYVTGAFAYDSIRLDSIVLYNKGATGTDIFILKYNQSGNLLWAKNSGGNSYDVGYGISIDRNSNLVVTGSFSSSMNWANDTLVSAGGSDIFIIKCDKSGNELWGKRSGGVNHDEGLSISMDNVGNTFATGYFGSPSIIFDSHTLINLGDHDIFVVKFDTSGNTNWAKRYGNQGWEDGWGIANDADGNAWLTGQFKSDTITFDNYILLSAEPGFEDFYLAYFNGLNGNTLWATSTGENENDAGTSVCVDPNGNIYVTGGFGSSYIIFGNDTLINSSNTDVFVAKIGSITTGITDIDVSSQIIVYPNPTSGLVYVSTSSSTKQIQLYNSMGQHLQTKATNGQTQSVFQIENDGLYFLIVTDDNLSITKKVVVYRE